MRAVVLVSHGPLAQAMKDSVQMIAGENDALFAIGLAPSEGPEDLQARFSALAPELEAYQEVYLFSDLYGGSPGNAAVTYFLMTTEVQLISGFNFPMILTALLEPDADLATIIAAGQNGIVDVRAVLSQMDDDDDE